MSARIGLLDALRAMGGSLGEVARVRVALLGVELREEMERRKRTLLLAVVAVVFLHAALLTASMLVVTVFWESHRIAALAATVLAYVAAGATALMRLRALEAASPAPFAATRAELDRDLRELGRAP